MRMLVLAFAVTLLGGVAAAAATETKSRTSTGDLLEACKAHEASKQTGRSTPFESGCCIGYLVGFMDGHDGASAFSSLVAAQDKPKPIIWGVPHEAGKVQIGQVIAVFIKWAEAHPERWHENRAIGLVDALREAWPCKR